MKQTFNKTPNLYRCFIQALVIFYGLTGGVSSVAAASLGKMKVLSALGASFKAEIELSNIKSDEDANLTARLSPPDVFKQAGIDYNPALASIRVNLLKEGGSPSILLTSNGAINEPLLEMLIELSWQSGRLVRQYTVLLDPITSVNDTPASTAEQIQVATAPQPQLSASLPAASVNMLDAPTSTVKASTPFVGGQDSQELSKDVATNKPYDVRKGDTLYGIASRLNTGDTAQVKVLMALLLKNNPHAFVGNDLNKLKTGVVLNTAIRAPGSGQDSEFLSSQPTSKTFSQYKQVVVNKATPIKNNTNESKSITNVVKAASKAGIPQTTQDQLKVSGNATIGNKATTAIAKSNEEKLAEEKLAKDRAVAEEKSRVLELQKNIQKTIEIKNNALAGTSPALAPRIPATTSAPLAVAPAVSVNSTTPAVIAGSAIAKNTEKTTDSTLEQLNKATALSKENKKDLTPPTPPTPVTAVAKPIQNETSWYEDLDPLVLGGVGGIGLLLAAWFWYRKRQANNAVNEFGDSVFNAKSTQGTLLTADGGQAVDTFNSVFVSSFSDANTPMESAEVDPVAEADVYMQYGRDAHAEDILKDALKQKPNRHSVRLKLMQLYASKQNHEALKTQFQEISELTQATDTDRLAAQQIMNEAKLSNSSLEKTASNSSTAGKNSEPSIPIMPRINLSEPTQIGDVVSEDTTLLKYNTNINLTSPPLAVPSPKVDNQAQLMKQAVKQSSGLGMPIDLATEMGKVAKPNLELHTKLEGLDFDVQSRTVLAVPNASPLSMPLTASLTALHAKEANSGIDFQTSKVDSNATSFFDKVSGGNTSSNTQALETKFSLAQAYMDIGDKEGAKELLQEVLESGHQSLTLQAKSMLAKI
jgi:pilus assembly protein FimV